MTDKYQVALKFLKSVTAKIDDSLPSSALVVAENASAELVEQNSDPTPDMGSILPSLRGHVTAFERRVYATHTVITPTGSIELGKVTPDDDTSLLLPRNKIGSDIAFDRSWRKLASVYYLGSDISIGYMCVPQQTVHVGECNKPIGQAVVQQIIKNARDLAITRSTRLLLAVGSLSGFDRETEEYVGTGLSNDTYLHLCLLNLGSTSGFFCDHSDPWVSWGIRYFITEFSDSRLEEVKKDLEARLDIPGKSMTRTEISSFIDCSLNIVDLAFLDLVTTGRYEVISNPKDGATLRKR